MNFSFRPPSFLSPPPDQRSRQAPRRRRGMGWLSQLPPQMLLSVGLMLVTFGLSALVWLSQALRWPAFYLVRGLDTITGGAALPIAPWIAWTVWGAVMGGALGYWLVAPSYGERENRPLILLVPLVALGAAGGLLWLFTR